MSEDSFGLRGLLTTVLVLHFLCKTDIRSSCVRKNGIKKSCEATFWIQKDTFTYWVYIYFGTDQPNEGTFIYISFLKCQNNCRRFEKLNNYFWTEGVQRKPKPTPQPRSNGCGQHAFWLWRRWKHPCPYSAMGVYLQKAHQMGDGSSTHSSSTVTDQWQWRPGPHLQGTFHSLWRAWFSACFCTLHREKARWTHILSSNEQGWPRCSLSSKIAVNNYSNDKTVGKLTMIVGLHQKPIWD
jgi:hypothetical protein